LSFVTIPNLNSNLHLLRYPPSCLTMSGSLIQEARRHPSAFPVNEALAPVPPATHCHHSLLKPSMHASINSPPLPGELILAIINLLADRRTILLCSLISRASVPWTRHYLFNHVRLDYRNIRPFLLLIQSPHCTLNPYVLSLHIGWQLAKPPYLYHKELMDALSSFRARYRRLCSKRENIMFPIFHKATTPKITATDRNMPYHSHVMNVVCLFPAVEHLQIQLWGFHSEVGGYSGLPPFPRL
jgi:hypothetical protein